MSLKAKLEAVIYAAEEPVTLAQLATLFAADALEWKAGQEAARAQASEPEAAAETLPLLNEEFAASGSSRSSEPGEPGAELPPPIREAEGPMGIPIEIPVLENADGDSPAAAPELELGLDVEPTGPAPGDAEAEAKREARQRDREVRSILRQILDELVAEYASDSRGVEIREIAGGYRMATKPECHDAVRSFVKSLKPALKLSLPALETLAVIAYKQPVTAPEVNEIRGVESSGVFGSLLARKLIATAGRKQVIGRPILYKTTKEFLLRFGLKDLSELPSMEEFEKMAAIELEETDAEKPAEFDGAAQIDAAESEAESNPETDLEANLEPVSDLGPEPDEPSSPQPPSPAESIPDTETAEQASTTSKTE